MAGLRAFVLRTNALAVASAVIIGLAMNNVVNSLVNDILMPPIGYMLGNLDFSQIKWVLRSSTDPTKEVAIRFGTFINFVITFLVVAVVVYVINTYVLRQPVVPAEQPTKTCQYCKETVPADATRCRACASEI